MKARRYGDDEGSTNGQEPARKPGSGAGRHGAGRKIETTRSAPERPSMETPQPPANSTWPTAVKTGGHGCRAAKIQKQRCTGAGEGVGRSTPGFSVGTPPAAASVGDGLAVSHTTRPSVAAGPSRRARWCAPLGAEPVGHTPPHVAVTAALLAGARPGSSGEALEEGGGQVSGSTRTQCGEERSGTTHGPGGTCMHGAQ